MTNTTTINQPEQVAKPVSEIQSAVVRFAGDSGDGMQLAGSQFTTASAIFGNDISTLPDFPAEIRAPAGTLAGVSGFQVNFSSQPVHTPGDAVDALIAMNPAALKANLGDVVPGGLVIVNTDGFTASGLKKAGYGSDPLEDGSLEAYRLVKVPIGRLNSEVLEGTELGQKLVDRCKNFYALGLVCWLFGRPIQPTLDWIRSKFGKVPEVAQANASVLKTGFHFGETTELLDLSYRVPRAQIAPGRYRSVSGNEALGMGLITAADKAGKRLFYGSYPITPASDLLHFLARYKHHNVLTFQAEDEIAAVTSAIGASFAGSIGVTGTSGPGLSLKGEAIGLAVMAELPLVIVNVQRGGPSTGLPTKTEQADLLQAVFGRHGECPLPVLAASSPAGCFDTAIEAVRIAMTFMTPVILLSDGYLANGTEPWLVPDPADIAPIGVAALPSMNGNGYQPYQRDENLARPWALPGTPGYEHRIGGLEKEHISGKVSYDPDNHHQMVTLRAQKVANIAAALPPLDVEGPPQGDLLVVGWGGTQGAIKATCDQLRAGGYGVSNVHLRYLNPLPSDLGDVLGRFKRVLVPELNLGQLRMLIRSQYLVDAIGFNKVRGKPLRVNELEAEIVRILKSKDGLS